MANVYTTATLTYDIDTNTDQTGLDTLKGASCDLNDLIYVFSGCALTITGDLDCRILHVGKNSAGTTSTAFVYGLAGCNFKFKTGSGNGLKVENGGTFRCDGTSGSRCGVTRAAGETGYYDIDLLGGIFFLVETQVDYVDLVAQNDHQFYMDNSTLTILFSATAELLNGTNGSMTLISSTIESEAGDWALVNYGDLTMDMFSLLNRALLSIACATQALVFDDMPFAITESNPPNIVRSPTLGGLKSHGRLMGFAGRTLLIRGSFQTDEGGTNRLITHFLKLKYMAGLFDTFNVVWDEGSINGAIIVLHPMERTAEDSVMERSYVLEVLENY